MKAKCNKESLVMQSVTGNIRHPYVGSPYNVSHEGKPFSLPSVGAICYNVKIGDSVYGLRGDHIEPGVTIQNPDEKENGALNTLACVGNKAKVVSGDAKGAEGFVCGTHGGCEHVICYFPTESLEAMVPGDKILVKAQGQGMLIEGFEDTVAAMNIDPELFDKLNITVEDGKLTVPVVAKVPAYLMGSGIGGSTAYRSDYDIMTADREEIKRLGLDKLRFGDIVMLENCDTVFGRGYYGGAVTIGIVVHSDCLLAGHGPGVTTLLASKTPIIEGRIDPKANLADIMGV